MAHETEQQRHSPNRRQAKGAGRWRQRRRTKDEGGSIYVPCELAAPRPSERN